VHHDRRRDAAERCDQCGAPTKWGKPFCSNHIRQMPYVAANIDTRLRRRREEVEVGPMDGGVVADDLSCLLTGGMWMTLASARVNLGISRDFVIELVEDMVRNGRLDRMRDSKGRWMIRALHAPLALAAAS